MKLADLSLEGRAIKFKLPEVPGGAEFDGKVEEGDEKIAGDFSQMGQVFPMNLVKQSAAEKAAEETRIKKAITDFTALIDSFREMRHIVGMSVALVKGDEVLISQGFGEKELGKGDAVDEKTLFAIGSSSKAFTAASLAILADQGKLDWEKPIREYLPNFKMYDEFATREMTAIDLMCHRSGLPRHDLVWYGSSATRAELFSRLQYLKPNKSFRAAWQYQNLMVMTAGYLAGEINGTTWEALVQKEIFDPLGMKNSGFSVKDMEKSTNAAKGYDWKSKEKESKFMPYRNIDAIGPAGSINSNAEDMSQWLRMQLAGGKLGEKEIISNSQIALMHEAHMAMGGPSRDENISSLSYGLGWMLYQYRGHNVVEHGGNIDGFSAKVFMMPDDELGLVILTNENGAGLTSVLSMHAADIFLDLDPIDWYAKSYGDGDEKKDDKKKKEEDEPAKPKPVKGTKPSHDLGEYAGEYFDPGYGVIAVKVDGKDMEATFNSLKFEMSHWHYDVFNAHLISLDQDMLMAFQSGKEGDINSLAATLDQKSEDIVFHKRAPAILSDPAFLEKLTGKYEFRDGKLVIEIELRSDNTLQANIPRQPSQVLEAWRNTQFKLRDLNGFSVEFVKAKNGNFDSMILRQPGIELEGTRKAAE